MAGSRQHRASRTGDQVPAREPYAEAPVKQMRPHLAAL